MHVYQVFPEEGLFHAEKHITKKFVFNKKNSVETSYSRLVQLYLWVVENIVITCTEIRL